MTPPTEGGQSIGDWAVLDLPPFARRDNELFLRSADDLAGCALIISTLEALRDETRPFSVHAVFTRAEEPGLFGARLVAEDGGLPRDAYVVSVEASNSKYAPAGAGIVVRAGDYHNTFSNEAERYLRVAAERLAERGIATQRRLLSLSLRAATSLADLWLAEGRPSDADEVLRPAYLAIGEGRTTRDMVAARTRLAALNPELSV